MSEMSPEPEAAADTVYGLPVSRNLPEGWQPLEVLAVVRALGPPEDKEYQAVRLFWTQSADLPSWEVTGMCDFVKESVLDDWRGQFSSGENAEEA